MEDGDGTGCPGGKKRRVYVHFECGVADEITYIAEEDTCGYRFDFATPAACLSSKNDTKS